MDPSENLWTQVGSNQLALSGPPAILYTRAMPAEPVLPRAEEEAVDLFRYCMLLRIKTRPKVARRKPHFQALWVRLVSSWTHKHKYKIIRAVKGQHGPAGAIVYRNRNSNIVLEFSGTNCW